MHLSFPILVPVGHPAGAGAQIWPAAAWTEERSRITGDRDPAAAYLRDLANEAMVTIRTRLAAGEEASTVVAEVVDVLFGGSGNPPIDRPPDETDLGANASRMQRDRAARDRITAAVLAILDSR
jgi:hypothetical protein